MKAIRKASLDSHAAARKAKNNPAACYAARANGQAVAACHVSQHAFGPAFYGLKIVAFKNPENPKPELKKELVWQTRQLPKNLRKDWKNFQIQKFPKNLNVD
ncbi:hypothetical protein HY989_00695 [Candidatus Micrarchaeota archaeon]|nr:hypothetical protein [Candidatus Micrarchaeota archaeon]